MGTIYLPEKNEIKCLYMHLDRSLTWTKHIKPERKQLNQEAKQMNWLLGRSTLSIESNLLYKAVLKPLWTYGGQPPIPTSKSSRAFNPRLSDLF
jgi:hypothetical protein